MHKQQKCTWGNKTLTVMKILVGEVKNKRKKNHDQIKIYLEYEIQSVEESLFRI